MDAGTNEEEMDQNLEARQENYAMEADFFNRDMAKVLAFFLLYSMAMFTLPFVAFFGTRHVLVEHLSVEGFAVTAWSVLAAVLMVNTIILAYAYRGYREDLAEQSPAERRSQLNVKQD